MKTVLAMHVTYEVDSEGIRQTIVYIATPEKVERFEADGTRFEKFIKKIAPGSEIRLTSSDSAGQLVKELSDCGLRPVGCHWHATGIEKNLAPEDIPARFVTLPDSIFRPIKFRKELAELRKAVALRGAIIRFHGDAVRRVKSSAKQWGITDSKELEEHPEFGAALDAFDEIRKDLSSPDKVGWDTFVERKARAVPECVLLAKIAGMEKLIVAGWIISALGDVSRFDGQVSAVWKYLGNHVVDGHAPKRRKGQVSDWNTKGRTAVYLLGQCIIKHRENPWRKMFDRERALEIAVHDQKHPKCKTKDGHCTARAIRKVTKEILKRFVLAEANERYVTNHRPKPREAVAAD